MATKADQATSRGGEHSGRAGWPVFAARGEQRGQHAEPPEPVLDLMGDDVELDLTGDHPRVARMKLPEVDHPWAPKWPTWSALGVPPSSTDDAAD